MKTRNTTRLRLSLAVALCVFASGVTQPANAQQFVPPILPDQPLFINLFVPPPNIAFGLDNSNSMEWRHIRLPDIENYLTEATNDLFAAIPFRDLPASSNSLFVFNKNDAHGTLVQKTYLSCVGANIFAYNPNTLYEPWPGFPDKTMTTAQFSDPGYETSTVNVSNNMIVYWNDDGNGKLNLPTTVWDPAGAFSGTLPPSQPTPPLLVTAGEPYDRSRDATNGEPGASGAGSVTNRLIDIDLSNRGWEDTIRYDTTTECAFPPTLYNNEFTTARNPDPNNAANTREAFFTQARADGLIDLVSDLPAMPPSLTNPNSQQNYANWYTYHRTGIRLIKNAVLILIEDADYRLAVIPMHSIVDFNTSIPPLSSTRPFYPPRNPPSPGGGIDLAVSLGDMTDSTHRQKVRDAVLRFRAPSNPQFGDTPLRRLLQRIGLYFDYTIPRFENPPPPTPSGVTNFSSPRSATTEIVSIGHDFWTQRNVGVNAYPKNNVYPDGAGSSCRRNFALLFTDGLASEDPAGDIAIRYNALNSQFEKLRPDFMSYIEANADGDNNSPYDGDTIGPTQSPATDTLADIAMHFYERDLNPNLPDEVPPATYIDPVTHITYTDNNDMQHLSTYIIGFASAAERNLSFTTPLNDLPIDHVDGTASPWPVVATPYNDSGRDEARNRELISDLRHAAFNSRGLFLSAEDAPSLNDTLQQVIEQIRERAGLSGSAIAQNSTVIQTTSRIFQASFNSGEWTGELVASSLTSRGELDQEVWRASNAFPTVSVATDRNIYTGIWSGTAFDGVRFTDNPIPPGLSFTLSPGTPAATPSEIIQYIAGVQDKEVPGGVYRQRNTLLGDIVSSSPISVGDVDYNYGGLPGGPPGTGNRGVEGRSYSSFLQDKRVNFPGGQTVVYVGSNNGMLHAFHDTIGGGNELFAYIPSEFWRVSTSNPDKSNITDLLDPGYNHKFYVNGEQSVGDAYTCDGNPPTCSWKSILVGGYGEGAKGIYALDVTDPFNFNANDVLWEYEPDNIPTTRANAQFVGYVKHAPQITRLNSPNNNRTPRWGVIFGGYSDTSEPVLFILDAATGDEIAVLRPDRGEFGDGYAQPLIIDENGDRIADTLYAGTLAGGLHKFDIRDANEANWKLAHDSYFFAPIDFYGEVQPIVTQPAIVVNPQGGFNLIVGTGKYLETSDLIAPYQVQSLYSIRDDNLDHRTDSRVFGRDDLLEQTIEEVLLTRADGTTVPVRIVNTNPDLVDYSDPDMKGWYLDLSAPGNPPPTSTGERVVSRPLVRGERAIFTSFIPSPSYCEEGSENSSILEINALSGTRLEDAVFDADGDGTIGNAGDYVTRNGVQIPVSGLFIPGTLSSPAVITLDTPGQEVKLSQGVDGEITRVLETATSAITRRQSWRQLR